MSHQNEENMKELFEKFMGPEEAQSFAEDVQKADEILREHPAPAPDDMLIANIKAEIAMRLPAKRVHPFMRFAQRTATIAAAILVIAAISLNVFDKEQPKRDVYSAGLIPASIWESDDITIDDPGIATLTAEIEQIEEEMQTLQYGENDTNGQGSVTELEMELIEINNSDFWKE
ncbi:MAG: hypothetical protein PVH77_08730 [Phycisphaerales bacterium]|jgi:hypothetical protein